MITCCADGMFYWCRPTTEFLVQAKPHTGKLIKLWNHRAKRIVKLEWNFTLLAWRETRFLRGAFVCSARHNCACCIQFEPLVTSRVKQPFTAHVRPLLPGYFCLILDIRIRNPKQKICVKFEALSSQGCAVKTGDFVSGRKNPKILREFPTIF